MGLSTRSKASSSSSFTSASASRRQSAKSTISKMTFLAMILSNSGKQCLTSSSSKNKVSRVFVSAFTSTTTTSSSSFVKRTFATSNTANGAILTSLLNGKCMLPKALHFSTETSASDEDDSSSALKATVEDDLDTALDDILGMAFEEAGEVKSTIKVEPKAVAPKVTAKDEIPDFTNSANLVTTNSYWIENGMNQEVIDVLSGKGITKFTEVQGSAFDPVMKGRDVIGRSRTGTGKTLAFGIPSLHRLVELAKEKGTVDQQGRRKRGRGVSMIVLCPTRELARQVEGEISSVARPLGLFTAVFHGGVSYDPQARALHQGVDVVVGTPGRVIDHINRGNLNLSECDIVVLDEADEMLNMGFAEDVEIILDGVGSSNKQKTQCLLFSATTPSWVKEIGRNYQSNVVSIDATTGQSARTATTVRHIAIQVPPGRDSKQSILEDIIAVEISKDVTDAALGVGDGEEEEESDEFLNNPIARAAVAAKKKSSTAMQQKIFGKTIVFTETKRDADELVSGGVFKSLSAQALHGDVGQKQRDATLNAFRAGSFNVLVATDVAARGIDIKDVDLVVQFAPPREVDTYVHRSGRTGRAGSKGTSVLLFTTREARDIVKIERSLGHGFKFELSGPPSMEAALVAASKTSALACRTIPEETAKHFKDSAIKLLASGEAPEDIVAKCLAAISRRASAVESRSLLTGESGFSTIEMTNTQGRPVQAGDVMFTVSKLARMSQQADDTKFDGDVGKIQANRETGVAVFDMGIEDAKKLIEYSKDVNAGGAAFRILKELELERGLDFGRDSRGRGGGRGGRGRGGYGRGGGGGRGGRGRGGGRGGGNNSRYNNNRSENSYDNGNNNFKRNKAYGDRREGGGGRGRGRGGGGGSYQDDGW